MATTLLLVNGTDSLLLVDGASQLLLTPTPPSAPTWVTPAGVYDVNATLALDSTFVDPGDSMGAFALMRDIGGTIRYWRDSDQTWQTTEIKNTDTTPDVTLAAGWGNDSDATHLYYTKTWDIGDNEGVYGAALAITPSAKANPTLDTPAAAATVTGSTLTNRWTVASQTAYLSELLNAAGSIVLWSSGWVTDTLARTVDAAYTLVNGTSYKSRLTTKNAEGLASDPVTHAFSVSFSGPSAPTLTFDTSDNTKIVITVVNAAAGGGHPATASNDLYRRLVGDTGDGERVATGLAANGSHDDVYVGHLEDWEYRALAIAADGTSTYGAWTS